MADQSWIDQTSLLVVWEEAPPGNAWIDQTSLLVVWEEAPPGQSWIDQTSLLVVWAESVPSSGDTSRRLAGDSIQGGPTATWAGSSIKAVGDA